MGSRFHIQPLAHPGRRNRVRTSRIIVLTGTFGSTRPARAHPGDNNEAGFFWLKTDSSADEKCTYRRSPVVPINISTTLFPTLRVRVAVNDGAKFKVEVFVEFRRRVL